MQQGESLAAHCQNSYVRKCGFPPKNLVFRADITQGWAISGCVLEQEYRRWHNCGGATIPA